MVEIAYFTPNQITGTAQFLDLWNADLFWGTSHLSRCAQLNQVEFRTDSKSWKGNISVQEGLNRYAVAQAIFRMPAADYFLAIVKLSHIGAGSAGVEIRVDNAKVGEYPVAGTNVEIPVTANLSQGEHWVSVLRLGGSFWFHSITCFQI